MDIVEWILHPEVSYNLSTFEIHLPPQKIVKVGTTTLLSKPQDNPKEQQKGIEERKAILLVIKEAIAFVTKEAATLAKHEGWIAKHAL